MKDLLEAHRRLSAMLDFAEQMETDLQRDAPDLAPRMPLACICWTNFNHQPWRHIHEHIDSKLLRICADAVADQLRVLPEADVPLSMLKPKPAAGDAPAADDAPATPAPLPAFENGVRAWIKRIRSKR